MAQKLCLGELNVKELDRSWIGQNGVTYVLTAAGVPDENAWPDQARFLSVTSPEIGRLSKYFAFAKRFSALDPCVGDGMAFAHLLQNAECNRYGIEVDANRAEQAKTLGIETLQANTMDVRCQSETVSLPYLNPPYDW